MALPVSYHWRNLFVRKSTTLITVLVISAVVAVFAWMLGMRSIWQTTSVIFMVSSNNDE